MYHHLPFVISINMSKCHTPPTSLEALHAHYAEYGIRLLITPKAVKNINFRLQENTLHVSYPAYINTSQLYVAILARHRWAVRQHTAIQNKPQIKKITPTLWGQPIDTPRLDACGRDIIWLYRDEMSRILPTLIDECRPICDKLGVTPSDIRLKKMHTRWGSCNTRTHHIWLSIYLAAHPYECCRYVYIHELCHLVHADHSRAFWSLVGQCLPDYRIWHDRLKVGI